MKKNKASATALIISKSIALSSKDRILKEIIDPKTIDLNVKFLQNSIGWKSLFFNHQKISIITKYLYRFFEKYTVPGIQTHYLLRKLKIEDIVKNNEDIYNDLNQIVIIGAGADFLGLRIAEEINDIKVFEIDHPDTQKLKKITFNKHNKYGINNFHLIPADLSSKSLHSCLDEHKEFCFNKKTIFIAEGVFMYLTIDKFINNIKIMEYFPKNNCIFVFTYITPTIDGRVSLSNQTKIVDFWLKIKKEPYIWALTQNQIDALLKELKFEPGQHYDSSHLKMNYLNKNNLNIKTIPHGENITYVKN